LPLHSADQAAGWNPSSDKNYPVSGGFGFGEGMPPFPGPPHPPGPFPPGPEQPNPMAACHQDFMRFCIFRVEDMDNPEQILQCMQSHSAELSPLCHDFVQNATARVQALHDGCDADMTLLCPGTPSFGPARKQCVVLHLADLSKPCLSAISALLVDMEAHHPHPPPGGPWPAPGMTPWGPGGPGGWPGGDDWHGRGGGGGGSWHCGGGPGGWGPGGPGCHRGMRFGGMVGAGVTGGLLVLLVGAALRCAGRAACCRRSGGPPGPPPPEWAAAAGHQWAAAGPQWAAQAFHVAQPVGAPLLEAEAGRPLPGGGAIYPAAAVTTAAGGGDGYRRF
jgi:hypothetical protein